MEHNQMSMCPHKRGTMSQSEGLGGLTPQMLKLGG
jgi:hypothetical protein